MCSYYYCIRAESIRTFRCSSTKISQSRSRRCSQFEWMIRRIYALQAVVDIFVTFAFWSLLTRSLSICELVQPSLLFFNGLLLLHDCGRLSANDILFPGESSFICTYVFFQVADLRLLVDDCLLIISHVGKFLDYE